jgi:hypothetical protein
MAAFNSMPTGDGLHGLSHGPTGQLEQSLPRFEQDINFEDPLLYDIFFSIKASQNI